ncbi:MAG: hypothetical protein OXD36_16810 [Rhodobacter sp.]|nr:hypothetical protein [Rhodobacter sp.]
MMIWRNARAPSGLYGHSGEFQRHYDRPGDHMLRANTIIRDRLELLAARARS